MQTTFREIVKYQNGNLENINDEIAVEEFLQIFVNGVSYAVIMRLPGEDLALVRGFCYTEGLIKEIGEMEWLGHCPEQGGENMVLVELDHPISNQGDNAGEVNNYVSLSSCGLCGKSSMKNIYFPEKCVQNKSSCSVQTLMQVKEDFEKNIGLFPRTGYTHSAAIYTCFGELLAFAEDVGRHNAMDKVVGQLLLNRSVNRAFMGIVSSRLSFEMVQKAVVTGLEIFAGVSAASSLAIETSREYNMTLIGFLRTGRMNIYTHPDRICPDG